MIYYDTNLLVYFTLNNLDKDKNENSNNLILKAIENNEFFISPLVLSEYYYVLTKLKVDSNIKLRNVEYFQNYINTQIDKDIVLKAIRLSSRLSVERDINDCIHIILAERHCEKLITYDKDFKHFIGKVNIEIDILS